MRERLNFTEGHMFLSVFLVFAAASLSVTLFMIHSAKPGYQDELGFHYGIAVEEGESKIAA